MNRRKFVLDVTSTAAGGVGILLHHFSASRAPSGSAADRPTMDQSTITQQELQARLDRAAADFHLPGAAIALIHGGQTLTAVTGVTNVRTRSRVVPETLFAAGSVTKVFTASLIMTYVDAGLVDLAAPVQTYLPDFTLQDKERSRLVTVRMLLDHTGGLPGNCMFDLPKSPHMIADIVRRLADMPLVSEPGEHWSYSNAGMVVLGRIAEVLSGTTFDEVMAARILHPLGLHATADTNEMILHSVAVGHLVDMATGSVQVVPRFQLDLSNSPAGATLFCDIGAMVTFARMHLNGGLAPDGTRVLSSASVAAMQAPQAEMPWALGYDRMGLGWTIRKSGGHTVVSHTGANAGPHCVPEPNWLVSVARCCETTALESSALIPSMRTVISASTESAPKVSVTVESLPKVRRHLEYGPRRQGGSNRTSSGRQSVE